MREDWREHSMHQDVCQALYGLNNDRLTLGDPQEVEKSVGGVYGEGGLEAKHAPIPRRAVVKGLRAQSLEMLKCPPTSSRATQR